MKKCYSLISIIGLIVLSLIIGIKESSAVPVFARKYNTSCATCHIGFPARNAFGEAFRNNGYRFPEGGDEEKVKIKQVELGSESWKKLFPDALYPADIPGIAPLAIMAKGTMEVRKDSAGKYQQIWGIPGDVELFFAGTIGENISIFGDAGINEEGASLGGFSLIWSFMPGLHLVLGDVGITKLFTIISAASNGNPDSYSVMLPKTGKGVELRLVGGDEGGYSFIVGAGQGDPNQVSSFFDSRFVRATYKIGGAGLLSGAGGTLGNEYIGLDNSITLGANLFNSNKGVDGEKLAYGGDITGNYGSFRGIAQVARWKDTEKTQISLEGDYFIYPWLVGVLRYEHVDADGEKEKRIIPGAAAFLRANAKLGVEYYADMDDTNRNSFILYAQLGF